MSPLAPGERDRCGDTFPAEWAHEADAHEPAPPRYAEEREDSRAMARGVLLGVLIGGAMWAGFFLLCLWALSR